MADPEPPFDPPRGYKLTGDGKAFLDSQKGRDKIQTFASHLTAYQTARCPAFLRDYQSFFFFHPIQGRRTESAWVAFVAAEDVLYITQVWVPPQHRNGATNGRHYGTAIIRAFLAAALGVQWRVVICSPSKTSQPRNRGTKAVNLLRTRLADKFELVDIPRWDRWPLPWDKAHPDMEIRLRGAPEPELTILQAFGIEHSDSDGDLRRISPVSLHPQCVRCRRHPQCNVRHPFSMPRSFDSARAAAEWLSEKMDQNEVALPPLGHPLGIPRVIRHAVSISQIGCFGYVLSPPPERIPLPAMSGKCMSKTIDA